MKLPRPARVPRSGREPRTPRLPRPVSAPVAATVAAEPSQPAPGSRWHMVRQSGSGVLETASGAPQVFAVLAVRPPNRASGEATVEYARAGERQPTRMNLAAFLNRFIPAS